MWLAGDRYQGEADNLLTRSRIPFPLGVSRRALMHRPDMPSPAGFPGHRCLTAPALKGELWEEFHEISFPRLTEMLNACELTLNAVPALF